MWLFVWSGSKMFPYVYIWSPEQKHDPDSNVRVVHFAVDEEALLGSAQDIVKEHAGATP